MDDDGDNDADDDVDYEEEEPANWAARTQGGGVRTRRRGRSRRKRRCPRKGQRAPLNNKIASQVVEGPEGPVGPEEEEEEEDEAPQLGGVLEGSGLKDGQGTGLDGSKRGWKTVLRAATTTSVTHLLGKFGMISGVKQQRDLGIFVAQLSLSGSSTSPPPSTSRLGYLVNRCEFISQHAKVVDLLRVLAQMDLALELDL